MMSDINSCRNRSDLIKPLIGILSISQMCNCYCSYCDIWRKNKDNSSNELIINALDQLSGLGTRLVGFTGGEPLMHPNLEKIVGYAKDRGLIVTVTTNGTLVSPMRVRSLVRAGCDAIMFSLDTLRPDEYFSLRGVPITEVLQGIKNACEFRSSMLLGINVVMTKSNIEDVPLLAQYCLENDLLLGITLLQTNKGVVALSKESGNKEMAQSVFKKLNEYAKKGLRLGNQLSYLSILEEVLCNGVLPKGFVCEGADRCISISSNGNISLCPDHPSIGNIMDIDLNNYWGSAEHLELRDSMRSKTCIGCLRSYRADDFTLDWLNAQLDNNLPR